MSTKTKDKKYSLEFLLIVAMLIALGILVVVVLNTPILGVKNKDTWDASTILDYRSNLFSGLLTAFGAWIGAGAAYFFGRESLREAYEGMKSLQQPSFTERLKQIKLKDIPPKALTWRPKLDDPLSVVFEKLDEKPDYWFIPIFDKDDLYDVQLEEAIWKYYQRKTEKEFTTEEIKDTPIRKFLWETQTKDESAEAVTARKEFNELNKFEQYQKQYVELKLTDSLYYANLQLDLKDVKLTIILDEDGKARYYVTASEFRQYMASL